MPEPERRRQPAAGAPPAAGSCLGVAFARVDRLLRETESLWRPAPFRSLQLPWEAARQELSADLRGLPDDQLHAAEASPAAARALLARWLPREVRGAARVELPVLPRAHRPAFHGARADGVPARKWLQIRAFVSRVPAAPLPALEWCSGKGHLARVLATVSGQPARCVERDPRLAHAGREIAREGDLPVDFAVLDALEPRAAQELRREQLACGLHACGELHLALMRFAAAAGTRELAISPCCYHLVRAPGPVSERARRARLALEPDDLRLALQETVTAGAGARAARERLAAYRLGFDLLQRELRGEDRYLPVPSVPRAVRGGDFGAFVHWAAERKGLRLPPDLALGSYERAGRERLAQTRRLSILRHLFRRPLEIWLVLDRALFLEEAGYRVAAGRFCPRRITPRNLMLRASR